MSSAIHHSIVVKPTQAHLIATGLVLIGLVVASCGADFSPGSTEPPTTSTRPSAATTSTIVATTTTTTFPSTTTTKINATTTTTGPSTTITPTTTTGSRGTLAGVIIVLDPGHNGMNWAFPEEIGRQVDIGTGTKACNTTGTNTAAGYPEARFTWEVALLAMTRLERLGATVILTRDDNDGWGPCITERAAIGNRARAGAVISIHADGGPSEGRGFHIIYPREVEGLTDDIAVDSLRLARVLHAAYAGTGMPVANYIGEGGYSERDDLGGLNLSDVPVVFLEAGNMRNTADAALLTDPTFHDRIAEAISQALIAFFNE